MRARSWAVVTRPETDGGEAPEVAELAKIPEKQAVEGPGILDSPFEDDGVMDVEDGGITLAPRSDQIRKLGRLDEDHDRVAKLGDSIGVDRVTLVSPLAKPLADLVCSQQGGGFIVVLDKYEGTQWFLRAP